MDLVLRQADIEGKNVGDGKLAANWEGSYRAYSSTDKREHTLETLMEESVPRTWNATKLKRYFS